MHTSKLVYEYSAKMSGVTEVGFYWGCVEIFDAGENLHISIRLDEVVKSDSI